MFNKAQKMTEEQKPNNSTETAFLPMQCYTPVLDACCGGRQFWFDKKNPLATYQDIREETVTWNDDNGHQKRKLEIKIIDQHSNQDLIMIPIKLKTKGLMSISKCFQLVGSEECLKV